MAWYGQVQTTRKLDQLIDQNPNLQQLLNYPDFIQQLKAYNPKLLDFITNSNTLISELIDYLTQSPKQQDSDDRKHKYPTLAIQMIQSDTIGILNWFFKENIHKKQKYLITMFQKILKRNQTSEESEYSEENIILPLLAGYFLRVNICLLNNKYKQAIDTIYQNQKLFQLLLKNCQSLSITNVLQVYLNLDLTKNNIIIQQRLNLKIKTINGIINIIKYSLNFEQNNKKESHIIRIQNLSAVLIQLLQKYYLIADGKQMIDQILNQQNNIRILFNIDFFSRNNQININSDSYSYEIALSMLSIMTSILKYFSFSSFNAQDWTNPETNKKNQVLLQYQTSIVKFLQLFPILIEALNQCQTITLYHLKIIQLINTAFTLNSHKIFNLIKKYEYLQILIDFLIRFQKCNILGMLIQKLFLLIFRSQRLINEEIKIYIFCQAKIIDLTAARYIAMFNNDEQLASSMAYNYRRKGYFGHLMKIMKIYSGIQTTNQDIINAIKSKSDIWNRISRIVLKPYQFISCKQLGSHQNIPQMTSTQFLVKSIIGANNIITPKKQSQNIKLIEQINRQETIQNLKTLENTTAESKLQPESFLSTKNNVSQVQKSPKNDDQFFKPATDISSQKKNVSSFQSIPHGMEKHSSAPDTNQQNQNMSIEEEPNTKRSLSYTDFMEKQKIKADTQIKKQRSRSKQRALSKGKTKITSPSPTKRVNKWAQNNDQPQQHSQGKIQVKQQAKQRPSFTGTTSRVTDPKVLPKIPHHKRGLNVSSKQSDVINRSMQIQKKSEDQSMIEERFTKSMIDLNQLKKVKIIYQFQVPSKRQYRNITQEDKIILDMLGIGYK